MTIANPPNSLTLRQREVLALMADGLSTKIIAARLGISYYTARGHIAHIYQRIGAQSDREALAWWHRTAADAEGLTGNQPPDGIVPYPACAT